MMKKNNVIITVLVSIFLIVGIHSVGQAAVVDNLIQVPTANIINSQGAVAGEIVGDKGRLEVVYKLDPRVEAGGEISSYRGGNIELQPLVRILFTRQVANKPALAAGLKGYDLYTTVSKSLGHGLSGHIGYGDGDFGGLFVGVNKVINPVSVEITDDGNNKSISATSSLPTTNLMVEYINQEINVGARIKIKDSFNLDLGMLDLDRFKLGVNYKF